MGEGKSFEKFMTDSEPFMRAKRPGLFRKRDKKVVKDL